MRVTRSVFTMCVLCENHPGGLHNKLQNERFTSPSSRLVPQVQGCTLLGHLVDSIHWSAKFVACSTRRTNAQPSSTRPVLGLLRFYVYARLRARVLPLMQRFQ